MSATRVPRVNGDARALAWAVIMLRAADSLSMRDLAERGGPSPAVQSLVERAKLDRLSQATLDQYTHGFDLDAPLIDAVFRDKNPHIAGRILLRIARARFEIRHDDGAYT